MILSAWALPSSKKELWCPEPEDFLSTATHQQCWNVADVREGGRMQGLGAGSGTEGFFLALKYEGLFSHSSWTRGG